MGFIYDAVTLFHDDEQILRLFIHELLANREIFYDEIYYSGDPPTNSSPFAEIDGIVCDDLELYLEELCSDVAFEMQVSLSMSVVDGNGEVRHYYFGENAGQLEFNDLLIEAENAIQDLSYCARRNNLPYSYDDILKMFK